MIKWMSILALSVAVVAGAVSGVVICNKREAAARAERDRAEALESAAKEEARKALSEEKAAAAKAEDAKASAKAAEENRIAKEAEREAAKASAAAAEESRKAAEAKRDEAEAAADRADAERAIAKAKAETARQEAERERRAAETAKAKAEAEKSALDRERFVSERVVAEAKLQEMRLFDLQTMEQELLAFRRELDEREKALRPEKTVRDLEGAGEDTIFDENGVARKMERKAYLAENDMTLPKESRELSRTKRLVAEARAAREKADRETVVATLLRLRNAALERDDVPSAQMYLSTLKSFYPDWAPEAEKKEAASE